MKDGVASCLCICGTFPNSKVVGDAVGVYRGGGAPSSTPDGSEQKDLIGHEKPQILFLSETLCSDKQLETLRVKVGCDNCLGMAPSDESPRVALLWMNDIPVQVRTYSARHVDVTISTPNSQEEWRLTGIYGYARTADRSATWALMHRLASQYSLSWLLVGDFNKILMNSEKSGGAVRRLS
ncbi:hypothetical protein ACLB2K_017187 [Fragaria x ananassa]